MPVSVISLYRDEAVIVSMKGEWSPATLCFKSICAAFMLVMCLSHAGMNRTLWVEYLTRQLIVTDSLVRFCIGMQSMESQNHILKKQLTCVESGTESSASTRTTRWCNQFRPRAL